ncbi:TetR/AcrR family transcriptional regulator [Nocardia arthritidis]|uniref:TetR family transcriptional regulator n=1 Tax=Nocardia arthritidis TaxID=228602 RepID=A0A6G9YTI4_9NOCA|nr:TetR/AcrR family transcriptional regulator [Nocardia arthritidis]QIS16514.1 TetR family transcriptional regulator [Nocardia arthritidis]
MVPTSRERIITAALRLFGEKGYAGTTIAQIEQAAGLSAGSGALYRHFRSKDELLVEAVSARLVDRGEWARFLDPDFSIVDHLGGQSALDKLTALCEIGLQRLEHDRDVTRILTRDNTIGPGVLEVFRRQEYDVINGVTTRVLVELAGPDRHDEDWAATAAVIVGAVAHFWIIRDIFGGEHPTSIDAQRYLRSVAELAAARLDRVTTQCGEDTK